jgi:hypothetical protein
MRVTVRVARGLRSLRMLSLATVAVTLPCWPATTSSSPSPAAASAARFEESVSPVAPRVRDEDLIRRREVATSRGGVQLLPSRTRISSWLAVAHEIQLRASLTGTVYCVCAKKY